MLLEINDSSEHLNKIKEIYLDSFPECERIDFEDLKNCNFPNSKILGIFDKETLVGFSYVSLLGNFAYIVYLAINKNQRNKNFGTSALNEICELYKDKTKVLCVEKPNSKEDIQSRRIGFYKRNGFMLADFEFEYIGQVYYSMYNREFNKQNFIDFLIVCFPGCNNFKQLN